ncbi:hypothetical protein GIB67_038724, partial [Kingdonia uniflora]
SSVSLSKMQSSRCNVSVKPHTNETCPNWFSPETGIYTSKHKPLHLPQTPFLDVVSFIFSHEHNGVSALIDSPTGVSFSYLELQRMVKSMASGLNQIGISQGEVVLIVLPNTIFFPVMFLSVLGIGAIATTMSPLSTLMEIKKQMKDCRATLVLTVFNKVNEIERTGVRVIGVPETPDYDSSAVEFSQFDEIFRKGDLHLAPRVVINQDDTAAILYSSGTSGASKGVVLSHRNLIAGIMLFVRFEAMPYESPPDSNVYLAAIPMFHVYGLTLLVLGLLSLGTAIVVMKKFDMNEMVRAIDKYGVTHFPVVPPILSALTRVKASNGGSDLRSLKQVSSGAAPLSEKIIQDFLQSFPHVDFIQGYGMTETTAVGSRGFNTKMFKKYTSVGLLAPNMEAKVCCWDTGACLPPSTSGELLLRGPGIMKGYLNGVDETRCMVDNNSWLRTGDIAHFDLDGYIYILDRLKDTIKYKGFQIAPADLESILISHPDVLDVAVTASRDDEAGEVPVAFVVKRSGSSLSQVDVINFVASQVAPYKKVRQVVFTHLIPKSAAGKILRRHLRNSLASRM